MSDFYTEMAGVTRELLAPTSAGGLGQGTVALSVETAGTPDPAQPWVPVAPTVQTETLRAAVFGAHEYADGVTILESDLRVICAVPSIPWRMASGRTISVTVDSRSVEVIRVRGIPDAGITSAVEFIVRA